MSLRALASRIGPDGSGRREVVGLPSAALALLLAACSAASNPRAQPDAPEEGRHWLAGDHHIHSRFSVEWDESTTPPTPIVGGDSDYAIGQNARMARSYGLDWMVSTDHGGPNHSKVNLVLAYPELLESRSEVPGVIQFYGMELDTPGAEHSSLIIPYGSGEHHQLYDLERRFARRDAFPPDSARQTEAFMLQAVHAMAQLERPPVLIVNHPSRSAQGLGAYGANTPGELRGWNDAAPRVAVGMEGAPGHQASALHPDGSVDPAGPRGGYRNYPTMGGFDQMTARLGGFWDSMLGEGRRWWITSTSDSHRNWRDGGNDFWPGEYSKTYVLARKDHQDILEGIRGGRVFVTTGDLVSELHVTAALESTPSARQAMSASIGGTLEVPRGEAVRVLIRVRDPRGANSRGETPSVRRVDLIAGAITGPSTNAGVDSHPSARVVRRFTEADWRREGELLTMDHSLALDVPTYVRVRGTSGDELEPQIDPAGEDPWSDLWFYSNPVFLQLQ